MWYNVLKNCLQATFKLHTFHSDFLPLAPLIHLALGAMGMTLTLYQNARGNPHSTYTPPPKASDNLALHGSPPHTALK